MQITQSIVKTLESECPRLANELILKRPEAPDGSPMQKGSFFETLCLGAGVGGKQTELPLLKKGKSAEHIRIEEQAERFKNMFNPDHRDFGGKIIKDKQLVLKYGDREGTIDFTTDPLIVYDLKLTADLEGGMWSDLSTVDFLQQIHYQWLYEQNYGIIPEMRLLVFDYSTKMRIKEIRVNITDEAINQYHYRFDSAKTLWDEYSLLEEFPRIPKESSCSKCPLLCSKRLLKETVQFEEITI